MTSKANPPLAITELPLAQPNQTGAVMPKKKKPSIYKSHIPFSYPTNKEQRNQIQERNSRKKIPSLNQELFLHNQGRSICSPVDLDNLKWLDGVDTRVLFLIEDFVRFIEECEHEAWLMCTDINGNKIVRPTLLGDVCKHYLPLLDNIEFSDLLNENVLYSNRFYALASACEQIQFEGLNYHDGRYENPLSFRSHWYVHDALIRYTRFNIRSQYVLRQN